VATAAGAANRDRLVLENVLGCCAATGDVVSDGCPSEMVEAAGEAGY